MKDEIDRLYKRIISEPEPSPSCAHHYVISCPEFGVFVVRCSHCGASWMGRMEIQRGKEGV
jgi:hypothetical protein